MKVYFLLKGRYKPYYKWSFRALRLLAGGSEVADRLSAILMADHTERSVAEAKYIAIEEVSAMIIDLLKEEGLTDAICGDLEKHAYSVNDRIKDGNLRTRHILAAI